jgi:two-component system response regulator
MEHAARRIEVLLVEDNPGDVRLVKEALRDCGIPLNLTVARDGEEAIELLFGGSAERPLVRPHVILLDLNLPKRSGHEVLRDVKEDSNLRTIPVIIVSSAGSKEEVNRAYRLSANCYIRKPLDLDSTLQTIRDVCSFWFQRVTLPIA